MNLEYIGEGVRDGPVILLYGNDPDTVRAICEVFHSLAKGIQSSFALHEFPGIKAINNCRLLAVVGSSDKGISRAQSNEAFRWVLSPSGWDNVAGLAEPFSERENQIPRGVRFQWLSDTGEISLIISTERRW